MKEHLSFSVIARIFASVLLFWAALSHHPSGYYTLLRWVVFGVGAYSAYIAVTFNRTPWAWCFGLIALFFNPLIPVWLNRATWVNIDVVTGIIFILSIFFTLRRTKKSTVSQAGIDSKPSQRYASVSLPKERPKTRVATSHVPDIPADFGMPPEVSEDSSLGKRKREQLPNRYRLAAECPRITSGSYLLKETTHEPMRNGRKRRIIDCLSCTRKGWNSQT